MKRASREDNNHIAKLARHAVARSSLDISQLSIFCTNGNSVSLAGSVRAPLGHQGDVNVRAEFETLKNLILGVHGIREVNADQVKLL
jgi:hypothetical protein